MSAANDAQSHFGLGSPTDYVCFQTLHVPLGWRLVCCVWSYCCHPNFTDSLSCLSFTVYETGTSLENVSWNLPIKTFFVGYPTILGLEDMKRQTLQPSLLWICLMSSFVYLILILKSILTSIFLSAYRPYIYDSFIHPKEGSSTSVWALSVYFGAIISLGQEIIYLVDVVWWNLFNSTLN